MARKDLFHQVMGSRLIRLAAANLVSKALGFGREVIIASLFGASPVFAGYLVVRAGADLIGYSVGGGLQANVVPRVARALNGSSRLVFGQARKDALILGFVAGGASFVFSFGSILVNGLDIRTYIFISLIIALAVCITFYSSIGLYIHQADNRFGPYILASIATSICLFALVYPFGVIAGIAGLAATWLVASLVQSWLSWKDLNFQSNGDQLDIGLKSFDASVFVVGNISLVLILGAKIISGANGNKEIAYFNYASVLLNVIITALARSASMIGISDASRGKFDLYKKCASVAMLIIMVLVIFAIFGRGIISIIFQRGAFLQSDSDRTAKFVIMLLPAYGILAMADIFASSFLGRNYDVGYGFVNKMVSIIVFFMLTLFLILAFWGVINNVTSSICFIYITGICCLIVYAVAWRMSDA